MFFSRIGRGGGFKRVVKKAWIGLMLAAGTVLADAGNCLDFNGIDIWGVVPDGVIPTNGDFTVECWAFCAMAPDAYCGILSQGTSGNAFYFGTDTNNNIRLGDTWTSTGVAFPLEEWHHFALVKSSTNTIFYMDGTNQVELGSAIANPAGTDFRIGRQYGSHGEYWPGSIDELHIWNTARTAAQISTNMNLALNGDEPGLLACWHFNETSGSTFSDETANGNNGTLSNAYVDVWVESGAILETPVRYVWTNSPSPASPYASWATAAHDIQTAVDAAESGETVLVTNGTYYPSAEITVEKTLLIESVNGPEVTVVDAQDAHRCFNLGTSACAISGLTITRGYTAGSGGGIHCSNTTPVVTNCIVSHSYAAYNGGGMDYGTAYSSLFTSNFAGDWGGAMAYGTAQDCLFTGNFTGGGGGGGAMIYGTAKNCLFTENSADYGGALFYSVAWNCTIVSNSGNHYGGFYDCSAYNCIAWDNTPNNLGYVSPVYNTCSPDWITHGVDGNITNNPQFVDAAAGDYHLQTDSPCVDAGNNGYMPTDYDWDGNARPVDGNGDGVATVDMGIYEAPAMPFTSNHYVSLSGSHTWPYTNWAMAATSIPVAVSAASDSDTVIITNGTYYPSTGIVVDVEITIESVNGPEVTVVDAQDAHRGFELGTTVCAISGLTITRGYTADSGGGIHCSNTTPVVTNCIVSHSYAAYDGGGMDYGTAYSSLFASNSAGDWGGAMAYGTAQNCLFTGNFTGGGGGAMVYGTAQNCLFTENSADYGGALFYSVASNCTIVSNSGNHYGGFYDCSAYNCIARDNTPNNLGYVSPVYNTCSPDGITHGVDGNITNNPQFADSACHLGETSPCIDAGSNGYMPSGLDFDGVPRPLDGNADGTNTVDMGCFEFASEAADSDGDVANDRAEVIADTDPLDSNDWFHLTSISSNTVFFNSSGRRLYMLLSTTNLIDGDWFTNQVRTGIGGADSMQGTNDAVKQFYRLSVQVP